MDLDSGQEAFVHLLGQLKQDCKLQFLEWVCREYNPKVEPENGSVDEEQDNDVLDCIVEDIRSAVPPTALAPNESQVYPTSGKNCDLQPFNTLHVDSFLYPAEEDVESLLSKLDIGRSYCLNCCSWKTKPLNFISHSISKEQLKFIFCDLLPNLSGKTVLDIGSRLGPILYGGYVYSNAANLIGVEVSSYFCEVQQRIVVKYKMEDRIKIVCSDICQQSELLQQADVIVMNNVFEFFCEPKDQARSLHNLEGGYQLSRIGKIWEFLHQRMRKRGTLLVTIPSIQESCQQLSFESALFLEQWVTEVNTGVDPEDEELGSLHLYQVR